MAERPNNKGTRRGSHGKSSGENSRRRSRSQSGAREKERRVSSVRAGATEANPDHHPHATAAAASAHLHVLKRASRVPNAMTLGNANIAIQRETFTTTRAHPEKCGIIIARDPN